MQHIWKHALTELTPEKQIPFARATELKQESREVIQKL